VTTAAIRRGATARSRATTRRGLARRRLRGLAAWWKRASGHARLVAVTAALSVVLITGNWLYHVLRKPSELVGLVAGPAPRTPGETWRTYGPLFRRHSTEVLTPDLLGALVQIESAGDPAAHPAWRWRVGWSPLEWYGPASSAVGLLQITDATFADARRYCIHDHRVARVGAVTDLHACWFNAFYTRLLPSHAIEMTSAWLTQATHDLVAARGVPGVKLGSRQDLAAAIHLCGLERGRAFVRHGFRVLPGERCGDHGLAEYLGGVRALAALFRQLERSS